METTHRPIAMRDTYGNDRKLKWCNTSMQNFLLIYSTNKKNENKND